MRAEAFLAFLLCACGAAAQESAPEQLFQDAAQAQQRGDYELAVRKFQELIRVDPNIVAAHANLGVVLVSLGRFDEAITQYHIALAEAPGSPALQLDLGLAYYKRDDFAGAAAQFASLHKAVEGAAPEVKARVTETIQKIDEGEPPARTPDKAGP